MHSEAKGPLVTPLYKPLRTRSWVMTGTSNITPDSTGSLGSQRWAGKLDRCLTCNVVTSWGILGSQRRHLIQTGHGNNGATGTGGGGGLFRMAGFVGSSQWSLHLQMKSKANAGGSNQQRMANSTLCSLGSGPGLRTSTDSAALLAYRDYRTAPHGNETPV